MAGVNLGGQAANVPQAVGLPDERPPTPEEDEVYRRLVREFRDNGNATLLNFCLNGEERFPPCQFAARTAAPRSSLGPAAFNEHWRVDFYSRSH